MNASAALRTLESSATRYDATIIQAFPTQWAVPRRREAAIPRYQGGTIIERYEARWTGIRATLVDVRSQGAVEVDLRSPTTRLLVMTEAVGGSVEMVTASGARERRAAPESGVSVIAANDEASLHACGVSFFRHLILDIDGTALAELADEPLDLQQALKTRLTIGDERLMKLCRLIAEECASDETMNRLYGDGLSIQLLRRLAMLSVTPTDNVARGGLAPWQLRRVLHHLKTNLAEDVPMPALAEIAGLSESYFRRAFKTSTGIAPHQWLVQARCDRAKQLLLENRLRIAEIALDVGFCDQAHFTRAFVRSVGTSPGAWRRERCPDSRR